MTGSRLGAAFSFASLLLASCGGEAPVQSRPAEKNERPGVPVAVPVPEAAPEEAPPPAPEELASSPVIVSGTQIRFVPATCWEGSGFFYWGLGSVSLRVVGHEGDECVFDYMHEVEGGYSVLRCRVPLSEPHVVIREARRSDVGDYGTRASIVTSFPLEDCECIESGSVWEKLDELTESSYRQRQVYDTNFVSYVRGFEQGTEPFAEQGSTIVADFTLYEDRRWESPAGTATLSFRLGDHAVGLGLEAAVEGLGAGGVRQLYVREEIAEGVRDLLPEVRPESQLAMRVEVKAVD